MPEGSRILAGDLTRNTIATGARVLRERATNITMPRLFRMLLLLALCALLPACSAAARASATLTPAPTNTPVPTATPAPTATPVPTIAAGVMIGNIAVGGLNTDAARAKVLTALAVLDQPIALSVGDAPQPLAPASVALTIGYDAMLGAAATAASKTKIPLDVRYDTAVLRTILDAIATDGTGGLTVITATDSISRSFVLDDDAGVALDDAISRVNTILLDPKQPRTLVLPTIRRGAAARPTREQLQQQLELMTKGWKGVIGVAVYDLAAEETVAAVNSRTVFHAASTIKAAIMLNAYYRLERFTPKQEAALKKMIIESDNLAANAMLSYAAGQPGTEGAIVGGEEMSAWLNELGLKNTYQYAPYEALEYIKLYNLKTKAGPKQAGEPPFTDSGRYLRTSPAEMLQLYVMIAQCADDRGVLIERHGEIFNAARCKEMITRLEQNADRKRMVSGLPAGTRVAHKSGWIPDMQADAGIVRSPGGDFVIAIYVYRPLPASGVAIPDRVMQSTIGAITNLVYTYYNPRTP